MRFLKDRSQFITEKKELVLDPNYQNFWHGGDLSALTFSGNSKSKFEYGPGLYLTTSYDVVQKYTKGSRKLYLVSVENGNDLDNSFLPLTNTIDFINNYCIASKRKEIINKLTEYSKEGKVAAYYLNNMLINHEAIKPNNTVYLRDFYTSNNIDYSIVYNAFGYHEKMMVLFNTDKIKNIVRVDSTYQINQYDIPYED